MPRRRIELLSEAQEWLSRLQSSFAADAALRHQDANIELETFFCHVLNFVFDWKLVNANTLHGRSQDFFDLFQEDGSLAVAVTVTTTAAKIREILKGFVGKHDRTFRRLLFAYPKIELPDSRADFRDLLMGFNFDPNRDRIELGSILQTVQSFSVPKIEQFVQLLRNELCPLGRALPTIIDNADQHDTPPRLPGTYLRAVLDFLDTLGTQCLWPIRRQ